MTTSAVLLNTIELQRDSVALRPDTSTQTPIATDTASTANSTGPMRLYPNAEATSPWASITKLRVSPHPGHGSR